CFSRAQPLGFRPLARGDQGRCCRSRAAFFTEQRHLRGRTLGPLAMIERSADRYEQACAPCVDGIERAGTDQRLDGPSIDAALVDAAAEIEQVGERRFRARRDDRLDRGAAGTLDSAQAVADTLA